jgi:outer membrane protein assembly factor BamB
MRTARLTFLASLVLLAVPGSTALSADWVTSRGDFHRTGNPDGKRGPDVPRILWVYKAKEHFIASPTPGAAGLYTSALGAYNTGMFRCLSLRTDEPERVLWSKSAPFLKRPTVCSPAVSGGLVIFGDGMHQTDDAWLYALRVDTGRLAWQLSVPGKLVHLEAPPSVDGETVYVCGGAAGVICLSLQKVTFGNEEMDLAQAQERMDKAWAEIKAKYEVERAKHPDFAVPPDEDSLQKPSPKMRWQKGKDAWHVDSPVAVADGRVYVTSCFLDEEQLGKRSLLCLRAGNGDVVWEAGLQINPWAGPTVAGSMVFVAGSTIRFDPNLIKQASGDVAAFERSNGQLKWRQSVQGGVLSPVTVTNDVVYFTSTDGKLRALDASTGDEKWAYDAGRAFFAGPAVSGPTVYVVDLKGVLHAVNAKDGKRRWQLDVPAAPEVFTPGMVYGSPVVADGRIYVGTCNVHSGGSDDAGAIVCIADESVKALEAAAVRIDVDTKRRIVSVPCRVAPRKLPFLAEIYPLEVVASLPAPSGQKAHETVVTFEPRPSEIRNALLKIGLKEGKPIKGDSTLPPTGDEVRLFLEIPLSAESVQTVALETLVVETRTGRSLPRLKWHLTGSAMRQPDPEKDLKVFGADASGTLATLFPVTDETIIQSSLLMSDRQLLRLETNKDVLPPEGTSARLLIAAATSEEPSPPSSRNGAPAHLSWQPPSPGMVEPFQSSAQALVPFDSGRNALPPVSDFAVPRLLPVPPQPIWRRGLTPVDLLFTGTAQITTAPPPTLATGLPVQTRRQNTVTPIALPVPVAPAVQPGPESETPSVGAEAAVFRTVPLQRQSVAPRILFYLPDPFEVQRALHLTTNAPDSDKTIPPPPAPAVTNLQVSAPLPKETRN